jgi:hypothetical protein
MVREIVKSVKQTYTLNIPEEMIGKTVEVIAFEISAGDQEITVPEKTVQDVKNKYGQYPTISHRGFSFDRGLANDYE